MPVKKAMDTKSYTRSALRKDSFANRIITPIDIGNDDLDDNPEILLNWTDRNINMIEEKAAKQKKVAPEKSEAIKDPDKEFRNMLKCSKRMLEI